MAIQQTQDRVEGVPERRRLARKAEPARGPEHDQLSVFAGRWQAEGAAYGQVEGRMIADETWEWLQGGFFLVCRFDSHVGDTRHRGIGYLAWDAVRGTHTCRMIDNFGYDRLYELACSGRTWTFRGDFERATYRFAEDGRSIDIRWEYSEDGGDFRPLCELKAIRVGGLGPTTH